jgi:predicted RNA-binding Zn-ribbon protein involved in translation (DUF1610 family)
VVVRGRSTRPAGGCPVRLDAVVLHWAEVTFDVEVDTRAFIRFLEMLSVAWPPMLDPDMARWEDDGGPPAPDPVNYTHTIAHDDTCPLGPWWTTYRLEGGERVPMAHTGPPAADAPSEASIDRLSSYLEDYKRATVKRLFERRDHRYVAKTIHIDDGQTYRDVACPNCGRHRVQGAAMLDEDGVCEKCGWDADGGDYATVTRP